MSGTASRVTLNRLTILSAAVALIGSGVVAANLAGAASGPSAVDYAQCQNGGPNSGANPAVCQQWINGILNANNSQFHEDEVTPQRMLVAIPDTAAGSHVHSVTIRYMARKAKAHAYDYLASVDATVTDAVSKRCTGVPYVGCSSLTQGADADIVPDPTAIDPVQSSVSNVTSDHMSNIPASKRKLKIFGATFTTGPQTGFTADNPPAMTTPVHDCTSLGNCTGTSGGDDYATTTFSFKTPDNTGNAPEVHYVQILFGGHLAAGQRTVSQLDGWGTGNGASSISGGPYHIKWDAADGASVGNRDNQIQSSAIIAIIAQGTSISTVPTPSGNVVIGTTSLTTAHDRLDLTVASSSHPPTGTASFDLYGPFTSAPTLASDCVDPGGSGTANRLAHLTSASWTQDGTVSTLYHATSGNVDLTATTGFAAGKYYQWVAHYDPTTPALDPYNEASNGSCTESTERIHVTQATAAGTSTQTIKDTVTVTGYGTPTGTVDWYLYSDSTCTTLVASDVTGTPVSPDTDTNNSLSSGAATSKGITPTPSAGGSTYYWKVYYNGDTNNAAGIVEACGVQRATIQNAPAVTP